MLSLDLETAPVRGFPEEYALQPWRYKDRKAKITAISVAKDTGEALLVTDSRQFRALLKAFAGETFETWNGIFDVAWLIAYGFEKEVRDIHWVDTSVTWKWLINSQATNRIPRWSLSDGANYFFGEEKWCQAFIKMKKAEVHSGENDAYWETRAKLDAIVTARIAREVYARLDDRRTKSAMITMSGIVPLAKSWVTGVNLDFSLIDEITPSITREMAEIEYRLGCHNAGGSSRVQMGDRGWTPSKVLRSTKQLRELLYTTWKLECRRFTDPTKTNPEGNMSTDKAALTYLADECDEVIEILRWRKLNTQLTKYIQSPLKSRRYLGCDTVHPGPKMFSTYTGRATYGSKTLKKYPTGVALHQWPRLKSFRAFIVPRKGMKHVEFDASGQESRLMASYSRDVNMKAVFNEGRKFHANTAAKILGTSYENFMTEYKNKNELYCGEKGYYYLGKVVDLSENYRIGLKAMRVNARVQYGITATIGEIKQWDHAFHSEYPGVKRYHKEAVAHAKLQGYAETMAGRQYKLMFWGKEDQWTTQSSAIMTPIQGTGADMTDLAIQEIDKHFPEFELWFTLHDGIHTQTAIDTSNSRIIECRDMLDNLDYQKWWGEAPGVPLLWDASVGPRWSELEELD